MKPGLASLGVLLAIALGACVPAEPRVEPTTVSTPAAPAIDQGAIERGAEERPPAGAQLTPTAVPTKGPITPSVMPPDFLPGSSPDAGAGLATDGPWVLYCDVTAWATLMDPDGMGRQFSLLGCPTPRTVSPEAGLALVGNRLVQFPAVEAVRWAPGDALTWSADGEVALLSNQNNKTALTVYDVAADRFRDLITSSYEITPMGLSPDGRWVVYREFDRLRPYRQPPGRVMAISTDRRETRVFFSEYGTGEVADLVLGWISDSTFLIQRQDVPCRGIPQNLELLHALLDDGLAWHIFDKYSYAAFDPQSGTVLLQELPPGPCSETSEPGSLVYLSGREDWQPHPVELRADWDERWEVRKIEWHPELNLFSVRVGETGGGPLSHVMTLTIDGLIVHEFPLYRAELMTDANLFPSADGKWILVGAAAPHGTRLYNALGGLVRELVVEGGGLSQGVQHVLWLPDEQAFLMSAAAEAGIFRAAAADRWVPELIEPQARHGTDLILVQAPVHPFVEACGGRNHTRLDLGDQVMVSYEPPLSSRLRSSPGLTAGVVDMLEPGREAQVLGGPVCRNRLVWWELQPLNADLRGWAAEGDADGAWLVPVGSSATAVSLPTPAPLPTPGPTATPLPILSLSPRGPWLVGYADPPGAPGEIRALNADGTDLTRFSDYHFRHPGVDLRDGVFDRHSLIGLRAVSCGITECDYFLNLYRLPGHEAILKIKMLTPDLAWEMGQKSTAEALADNPPLMAVGWEGAEPAMQWSPDGRYLAFVAAIDGPSADVYAFDSLTSAVLRLTDGPGQPVLMGWSPDSRRVVHMEVEFEYGEHGPEYDPVAVWAASVNGDPARYLYTSQGTLGESEALLGWRSGSEILVAERDEFANLRRLGQADVQSGAYKLLYSGRVMNAAVDPISGTVAFMPYVAEYFTEPAATEPDRDQGSDLPGGIYLLRRGSDRPQQLDYDDWDLVFESLEWIPEVDRFFAAWSVTLSFTADGQVGEVFPEHYIPQASPDGKWLVFRSPPHFPGIAVYTPDGDLAYEFAGMTVYDIVWKRDSTGVYLYSPEFGLRFFSPSQHSYETLNAAPAIISGSLRLIYP